MTLFNGLQNEIVGAIVSLPILAAIGTVSSLTFRHYRRKSSMKVIEVSGRANRDTKVFQCDRVAVSNIREFPFFKVSGKSYYKDVEEKSVNWKSLKSKRLLSGDSRQYYYIYEYLHHAPPNEKSVGVGHVIFGPLGPSHGRYTDMDHEEGAPEVLYLQIDKILKAISPLKRPSLDDPTSVRKWVYRVLTEEYSRDYFYDLAPEYRGFKFVIDESWKS
jgi:hypothetical protein